MQSITPIKTTQALAGDAALNMLPVLRRRWPLMITACILGLLASVAYFLYITPLYESTAELLVMQNQSASMLSSDRSGSESSVSEELLSTHMRIIQGHSLIKQALVTNHLIGEESLVKAAGDESNVVHYVRDNLYVTSGGSGSTRNAHVLNVSFRHTSPDVSLSVTEAIIAEYKSNIQSKFQDFNAKAIELIGKARLEIEQEILQLDKEYMEFRMNSPLLGSSQGQNIYAMQHSDLANRSSQLSMQITELTGRLKLVTESLSTIEQSGATTKGLEKLALIDDRSASRLGVLIAVEQGKTESAAFQASQPRRMAEAQTEYNELLAKRTQLAQLLLDFGTSHPDAVRLQSEIKAMETFLTEQAGSISDVPEDSTVNADEVLATYVKMMENDLDALKRQLAEVQQQMNEAETKAKELIALELQNGELTRLQTRKADLYDTVVERLRTLNLQEDTSGLVTEVITNPELGIQVQPNLPVALAIFMLIGLVLGGGSTLIAELMDRSIHEPTELEKILGCSILGHVPNFQNDPNLVSQMKQVRKSKSNLDVNLPTIHAPASRASEGFRAIRTQTVFSLGDKHKVLAVTSATAGEGKSIMASNLAISLALSGQKILLIDCDMRRPTIARVFNLKMDPGLKSVLGEETEITDCLQNGIVSGLYLLPSGSGVQNPAELLSSVRFTEMVGTLREKFDYVILDCPPVLPVADPAIITPLADGVIFVTKIDRESRLQAERASKILTGVGGKLLGVIVNCVDDAGQRYGYSTYGYESLQPDTYYTSANSSN